MQDRSGAILLRYPAEVTPADVGHSVRATGEVGSWYGGSQMEAESKPRLLGRARAVPVVLRRPPVASDEWRLVSVTVRITDVERSGDTWRAEATMGAAGDLPIAGLAGSGIDADGLEPGRSARIVGIVKRAHPSATDQRFAIAPRSRDDIALGRVVRTAAQTDAALDAEDGQAASGSSGTGGTDGSMIPSATLSTLPGFVDALVHVGGRLAHVDERSLTIDDGTAQAAVRLADAIERIEPALQVGEVLNVTGWVRERSTGGYEVVVRSLADVHRAAGLVVAAPASTEGPSTALLSATLTGSPPDGGPPHDGLQPEPAGPPLGALLLALILAGTASLLLGWAALRMWRPRRSGGTPSARTPTSASAAGGPSDP